MKEIPKSSVASEQEAFVDQSGIRERIAELLKEYGVIKKELEAIDPQNNPDSIDMKLLVRADALLGKMNQADSEVTPGSLVGTSLTVGGIGGTVEKEWFLYHEITRILEQVRIFHQESKAQREGTYYWELLSKRYLGPVE
jgi:hypothetical protein